MKIIPLLIRASAALFASTVTAVATTFQYNDPTLVPSGSVKAPSPAGYYYNFDSTGAVIPCNASARGLAQFVLEDCAWRVGMQHGAAPDYAWIDNAVTLLGQQQDSTTGMFKSTYNSAMEITDGNQTEFVVQSLATAMLQYGSLIQANDSATYASINTILKLAFTGIQTHKTGIPKNGSYAGIPALVPSYTNPWLMVCYNEVALGQLFPTEMDGSGKLWLQYGAQDLDTWIAQTRASGISEYISSTYYGVDLDSLGLLYNNATNLHIKSQAKAILDLYWTDLIANFFTSDERVGGTESRSYDFTGNSGQLYNYLYAAYLNGVTGMYDVSNAPVYWLGLGGSAGDPGIPSGQTAYIPPSNVTGLFSGASSITTLRRFNGQPGYDAATSAYDSAYDNPYATHYLVPGVMSVGTSSERYLTSTPESLTISLPSNQSPGLNSRNDYPALINFNMAGRGDPYQQDSVTGTDSFGCTTSGKPSAFDPFVASVQNQGTVLFLAANDGGHYKDTYDDTYTAASNITSITSTISFPKAAAVYAYNGTTFAAQTLQYTDSTHYSTVSVPVVNDAGGKPEAFVAFYLNGVVTAVRVLLATDTSGNWLTSSNINLIADGPLFGSKSAGSFRLSLTHWQSVSGSTPNGNPAVLGLAVVTQAVTATNLQSFLSSVWTQTIPFEPVYTFSTGDTQLSWPSMRVRANLLSIDGAYTYNLQGATSGLATAILNINGTEYASNLAPDLVGNVFSSTGSSGSSSTGYVTATGNYTHTLTGQGPALFNTADGGEFASLPVTGNFTAIARVSTLTSNSSSQSDWALAGIMVRGSATDAGSANAGTLISKGNGIRFSYRPTESASAIRSGFSTYSNGSAIQAPVWIAVTASGTTPSATMGAGYTDYTLTGYYSATGSGKPGDPTSSWLEIQNSHIGPEAVTLPNTVYVGLAISSGDLSASATATVDNFAIIPN